MEITILGNGGAVSDGLPYNSFLIDGHFLVECPPDIMTGLFREGVDLSGIRALFISHFHGDHCFGFPFLALRLFYERLAGAVDVFSLQGAESRMKELCALAFGGDHPVLGWVERHCVFHELEAGRKEAVPGGLELVPLPMEHFVDTLGFSLERDGAVSLVYFADTVWAPRLAAFLERPAAAMIADLNGEPGDAPRVHLSEADAVERILPLCAEGTVIYGTHLKKNKTSSHGRIRYVTAGDRILL